MGRVTKTPEREALEKRAREFYRALPANLGWPELLADFAESERAPLERRVAELEAELRSRDKGELTEAELRRRTGGFLHVGVGCEIAIAGTFAKIAELERSLASAREEGARAERERCIAALEGERAEWRKSLDNAVSGEMRSRLVGGWDATGGCIGLLLSLAPPASAEGTPAPSARKLARIKGHGSTARNQACDRVRIAHALPGEERQAPVKKAPEDASFRMHVTPTEVGLDRTDVQALPLVTRLTGADIRQRIDKYFHEIVVTRLADAGFEEMLTKNLAERVERAVRAVQGELDAKAKTSVAAVLAKHVERIVSERYEVVVKVELLERKP